MTTPSPPKPTGIDWQAYEKQLLNGAKGMPDPESLGIDDLAFHRHGTPHITSITAEGDLLLPVPNPIGSTRHGFDAVRIKAPEILMENKIRRPIVMWLKDSYMSHRTTSAHLQKQRYYHAPEGKAELGNPVIFYDHRHPPLTESYVRAGINDDLIALGENIRQALYRAKQVVVPLTVACEFNAKSNPSCAVMVGVPERFEYLLSDIEQLLARTVQRVEPNLSAQERIAAPMFCAPGAPMLLGTLTAAGHAAFGNPPGNTLFSIAANGCHILHRYKQTLAGGHSLIIPLGKDYDAARGPNSTKLYADMRRVEAMIKRRFPELDGQGQTVMCDWVPITLAKDGTASVAAVIAVPPGHAPALEPIRQLLEPLAQMCPLKPQSGLNR